MHLAIDSALGSGSVALCHGGEVLICLDIAGKGMQAKHMVSTVEQVLSSSFIGYPQLESIICTIGPGTFTGIRIALATARAIGFSAHKPVYGVSTLACLAYGAGKPCVSVLPAGKGMLYAQTFSSSLHAPYEADLIAESAIASAELPVVTTLDAEVVGAAHWVHERIAFNAALAGKLAADVGAKHLLTTPEPLYIRPPDITAPKTKIA